jgi:hypothetical protein
MEDTLPNSVAIAEPVPTSETMGLIGGMIDGMIQSFEYRGVQVHRLGNSIAVSPEGPPQDVVGGRMHVEGATILEVQKWLDAKVEVYQHSQ